MRLSFPDEVCQSPRRAMELGYGSTSAMEAELTDASGTAVALNAREAYSSLGGLSKDAFGERTV